MKYPLSNRPHVPPQYLSTPGSLLSGDGDLPSQYEALLAALDEEAAALDGELAGREAASGELLARMRNTKSAITARMDAMQAALQAAREAESDVRRQAADKDIAILKLQQQMAQLAAAAEAGGGGEEGLPMGNGSGQLAGLGVDLIGGGIVDVAASDAVISALRRDLDAAHERLQAAGRQLREAQDRAEAAEAEVRVGLEHILSRTPMNRAFSTSMVDTLVLPLGFGTLTVAVFNRCAAPRCPGCGACCLRPAPRWPPSGASSPPTTACWQMRRPP